MAIFALAVPAAACALGAGAGLRGASDCASAEAKWSVAIVTTIRKRTGPPTILFLKRLPPGTKISVMRKDAGMSRQVAPAANILHLAAGQSKVNGRSCQSKKPD